MKSYRYKTGVTLIEMLIVVGIIAILAALVITTAGRIEARANAQLTESTIVLIIAAVEQFRDYEYEYPQYQTPDFSALKFPLDCSGIDVSDIEAALDAATPLNIDYAPDEVWYYFLSRVPECRKTLDKIAPSLKQSTTIITDNNGREYFFLKIVDPWGNKIRYSYDYDYTPDHKDSWTFPVITSAGPDRIYGNDDDISSK